MLTEMGRMARDAFRQMANAGTRSKNRALQALAALLDQAQPDILEANKADIQAGRDSGMSDALIDRLTLTETRLKGMSADLRRLVELPDPVGERFDETVLPNGLKLWRQRVPLGVMAVIYESRPNVTIDVSGLAIKTGNAAILRGGKETIHSNRILVELVQKALEQSRLPANAVQFMDNPDRALVMELLRLHQYVDIIIPRGGEGLHRFCRENGQIPVITGGIGICHIFVDESADLQKALRVMHNAKTQRPSVCNALDTVLVHRTIAAEALPRIVRYLSPAGVSFRADESAMPFLVQDKNENTPFSVPVTPAGPDDFDTEWMSLVLGLKVVDGIDEAIAHTNAHSMGHSDSILTENAANAARWINEVDSAAVYVNASTRFTDGGQFGLGAEVAISTQRLHARGPMGLRELTTYKWVAEGNYHIRE
ncbi:MAG: glutamate-5-semialdehyde dehydrogenase [Acidobacteria bacterium]|nr:glutamate-5-semialdehyde dehydrogenase [Acidobacteriota bacterium]